MSIQEIGTKCKALLRDDIVAYMALLLAFGAVSFSFGQLSATEGVTKDISIIEAASVENSALVGRSEQMPASQDLGGKYVASKNGSRFYLSWCSGAGRIKEENKVWFKTKEEARSLGYTPAANCKGI